MTPQRNPYKNFSNYVLRAPLFPIDFYKSITKVATISVEELKKICRDKRIKEAIFLASPDLFSEVNKWLNGQLKDEKSAKIQYAIFKYLSRMTSRPTPFGLFAGTVVGEFADTTNIELDKNIKNSRHTRLDMNYLVSLSQTLLETEIIRNQLKFYPNTSLYKVGSQLRYIEYSYENTKRIHHIVGVNYTWYIEKILKASEQGQTIEQLALLVTEDDVLFEEAFAFVTELVHSQILISELEPSVSGSELLEHLLKILKKLQHTEDIIMILERVDNCLLKIDQSITNNISDYLKIAELLKPLNTSFELKYLFQTDMILSPKKNTLSTEVLKKIKSTFNLLNKISMPPNKNDLSRFNAALFERYETKSVPLSKALDKELGIGFVQDSNYGDVSTLVDDIDLPPNPSEGVEQNISSNDVQNILHDKLIACIKSNNDILTLTDSDFADLEENWNDLPDTMSTMIEMINLNGEQKIGMNYLAGSSAVNLLGRFCHGDHHIFTHVKNIIEIEKKLTQDKLLAEIVHLPEARVGNILYRPHLRDYEIPYLANSTVKVDNQININDLEVFAQSPNHLSIFSKKHKKEVIPRLSNAHDFSTGSLPVYHFLASSQNLKRRNAIGFGWGQLAEKFSFLPRVEYKDVILSNKLWNLKKADVIPLIAKIGRSSDFTQVMKRFMDTKNLPQFVMLKDGDNELLINFMNQLSVAMFLDAVKTKEKFQLKEFLHSESGIVKESANSYSNQIIVSFFNEEKLNNLN